MGIPQRTRRWLSLFFFFLLFRFFFCCCFSGSGLPPPLAVALTRRERDSGIGNWGSETAPRTLWALVLLDHHDLSSRNSKTVLSRESRGNNGLRATKHGICRDTRCIIFSFFLSRLSLSDVSPLIYSPFPTRQSGIDRQLLRLAPFSTSNNAAVPFFFYHFLFTNFLLSTAGMESPALPSVPKLCRPVNNAGGCHSDQRGRSTPDTLAEKRVHPPKLGGHPFIIGASEGQPSSDGRQGRERRRPQVTPAMWLGFVLSYYGLLTTLLFYCTNSRRFLDGGFFTNERSHGSH